MKIQVKVTSRQSVSVDRFVRRHLLPFLDG